MAFNVITNSSHNGEYLAGGQYSADFIDGLGGNDTIIGDDGADWLVGNNGDDKIYAGERDTDLDVVAGGNGNDEIYGGGGGDLMDGGAGDDFMGGGTGDDLMFGDSGVRSWDPYSLKVTHYTEIDNPFNLWGLINGSNSTIGIDDNYLNSLTQSQSGNDTMWGGTGRDMMFGGWGDDVVGGGLGDDLIVGNRDDDVLYGGAGADGGNDVMLGGDENDIIYGGAGNDIIDGDMTPTAKEIENCDANGRPFWLDTPKNVKALANNEKNGLYEGDNAQPKPILVGNDYLNGEEWVKNPGNHGGDDVLFGGDGDDIIFGREGTDMLWGGAGNDVLKGGKDDDGVLDNDTDVFGFVSGHGADTICEFNTGEWPEEGNGAWEDGEDVVYLEGSSYDGEFSDAVGAGHIVKDAAAGTVTINTDGFGLEGGGTILIVFKDNDGISKEDQVNAFGVGNLALDNAPEWVDPTLSWQPTELA